MRCRHLVRVMTWPVRKSLALLPAGAREQSWFETLSWIGRKLSKPLTLDKARANYVNLGCGPERPPGFINVDFFDLGNAPDYEADLRYPLPMDSEAADGIFTEHTLEHLTYAEAAQLLRECRRILKPGGVLRVIVPDAALFAEHYVRGERAWFSEWERLYFAQSADAARRARRLLSPMAALSFVTQEYGHRSCWDFETLRLLLERAGFRDIQKTAFRQGRLPRLLHDLDSDDRRLVSLYVEAVTELSEDRKES